MESRQQSNFIYNIEGKQFLFILIQEQLSQDAEQELKMKLHYITVYFDQDYQYSIGNMASRQAYLQSSSLSQQSFYLPTTSPANVDILLKSKMCVDKLGSRILSIGNNFTLNKNNTLKCVEQATKDIKNTIQMKVQSNFANMMNEQKRVKLSEVAGVEDKNKEEATKKLLQDYWQKRQQNQSEARRKTLIVCKQNLFPKINSSQAKGENTQSQALKAKKKAIISSLNVKIYEKQQERESLKKQVGEKLSTYFYSHTAQVIDFKVQNDTPEFLLFQKLNYSKLNEIDHILKAIQNFTKNYGIKSCNLDLQKALQLLDSKSKIQSFVKSSRNILISNISFNKTNPPQNSRKTIYTPHELLGCLENGEQISVKNSHKPGIRFYGPKGKIRAIIKIQSIWKGKYVFQKIKKLRQKTKSLIKIQRAYRIYLNYCRTKELVQKKSLEKYQWFKEKQSKFRQNFRINELSKKMKYEVHICSDGENQWQRVSAENYIQKQNAYFSRIFKCFKQNQAMRINIILVTAFPMSNEIINYYFKLLQLGGAVDFKNRITFLSPENSDKLIGKTSLARIIYYCPSVLKKIKSIVRDQYAYIVPATPSMDFIPLCNFLDLPLYSSNPQSLLYLQTKSGCKEFYNQVSKDSKQEEKLPFAINIYSLATLVNQLALLVQSHPHVSRWILKIDNQHASRGLAYFQTNKIIPKRMLKFLRKSESGGYQEKNISPQSGSLSQQLFRCVFESVAQGQKLKIVSQNVYKSQSQFLNFFYSNGGIVEAEVNSNDQEADNLCFCIQIQPDNEWKFVSSYKKLAIKKNCLSCYFDSQLIEPPLQIQAITKSLIKRKMFGYFVLSFIKQAGKDSSQANKTYFNGIKCYLDQYSTASYMRDFLSKQSNALYIPYIAHPNIKKISMATFFHLCRLQNISFDIERQIGNIFMFLDGLESGCLGMMTFNDSSKVETFIHAAQVLDFFSSKIDHTIASGPSEEFLLIRNSINGYLNLIRKKKLALKSNEQTSSKNLSYKSKHYLI